MSISTTKKLFKNPLFETKINKAVFLQQDLIVYPAVHKRLPDNFNAVIRFLFGESAHISEDVTDGYSKLIIEGATYELRNACTINADWICKEIEQ